MESEDKLNLSVLVNADPEKTFYAFAQQMTSWWPRTYTWSGNYLGHIVLEPEVNGAWYEKDGAGTRQPDWGSVLAWDPPRALSLSWAINQDRTPVTEPDRRSEVSVRFTGRGEDATLVELEHSGFQRHDTSGQSYRDALAGPEGWPAILDAFAAYAGRSEGEFLRGLSGEEERSQGSG